MRRGSNPRINVSQLRLPGMLVQELFDMAAIVGPLLLLVGWDGVEALALSNRLQGWRCCCATVCGIDIGVIQSFASAINNRDMVDIALADLIC